MYLEVSHTVIFIFITFNCFFSPPLLMSGYFTYWNIQGWGRDFEIGGPNIRGAKYWGARLYVLPYFSQILGGPGPPQAMLRLQPCNQTKIKGGGQSGRKVVPRDFKSDLPLVSVKLRKILTSCCSRLVMWYGIISWCVNLCIWLNFTQDSVDFANTFFHIVFKVVFATFVVDRFFLFMLFISLFSFLTFQSF